MEKHMALGQGCSDMSTGSHKTMLTRGCITVDQHDCQLPSTTERVLHAVANALRAVTISWLQKQLHDQSA